VTAAQNISGPALEAPLTYLRAFGAHAAEVIGLTTGLIVISCLVVIIVTLLLLGGLFRRRRVLDEGELISSPPERGLSWLYVGIGLSALVLLGSALWTFVVIAKVSGPPTDPEFTIEVVGRQWWWEIRYLSGEPDRNFTTANEIHLPVGSPVRVKLRGADVIHSFWVPTLAGKTDIIPGQTNITWIQADTPGEFRGQCAEFCGKQHARMGFLVVASPPGDFNEWWDRQLTGVPTPVARETRLDQEAFIRNCGVCHSVRGTRAGGILGPDLSHFNSRRRIAAATLPNTVGHLSAWIANPQEIKPGNLMPRLELSGEDLSRVRRFLATLE